MPLRPEDVVRTTFTVSRLRQGYEIGEVDTFLEEVVDELRRLHSRIDELEAAAMRTAGEQAEGDSDRVRLELQQLDLIRQERAELVEEMKLLQGQADSESGGEPPPSRAPSGHSCECEDELRTLRRRHSQLKERSLLLVHEQLRLLEGVRPMPDAHAGEDLELGSAVAAGDERIV